LDKAPDAFRTISEVADDLKLPQHVLRFWESRFSQIKPMKRAGGRRYYRPGDVDLLRGIHHLLYGEGYTIRGVQRILKEQGVKFVEQVWQSGSEQPSYRPDDDDEEADPAHAHDEPRFAAPAQPPAWSAEPAQSKTPGASAASDYSREDLRKLQSTLFELTECRRLLDAALREKP
jgi:DNA-binding transcriptional MerR regulator